ncbi:vWA domain-containing protein [Psychroflexus sp. MES1-P1E]|uniref:vWA domain-containing protein n=1 Tax=Psychroflexus sp. MES1-P1E TaxID=2058320 RepID=UPI000C7DB33D|nr:VWA domain-containing protein [Psychroflexus sp. MES1-P1E]PKG42760.1 hypothetical protein CXF67_08570 [Psychroflexus sp. MES1-P1E]
MKTHSKLIATFLIISGCSGGQYDTEYLPPATVNYMVEEEQADFNTEEYDRIYENEFLDVLKNPLSTFSIDVDAASYSNSRRFISQGQLPPKDAVRIEEFINYFTYDYEAPQNEHPFSIHTEISDCPWNTQNKLLHIGLQGKRMQTENIPENNLVFLLDVSGSMNDPNKLPLLKSSFHLLLEQLRDNDRIAIVVYAGAAGQILPSTSCDNKEKIIQAINDLQAGGSTSGGEGIQLAYKIAEENFKKEGNNRIILATDGDFNVGVSSDGELVRLIEKKRETGIYLSILGFGSGNYKDSKMEKLADHGNGNNYYIDNLFEAKKVLVSEMGGTLLTIAKDVKIQIEFNPTKVYQYRLIGYENRLLKNEDFEDDTKDAGELGAGHSVTALYEIMTKEQDKDETKGVDYKYQTTNISPDAYSSTEIATIRFRYKNPNDTTTSNLIEQAILDQNIALDSTSIDYKFSATVAEFGLLLRDSKFKGNSTYDHVIATANDSKGDDNEGYRAEFIKLVKAAKDLDRK